VTALDLERARRRLKEKSLDLVVANDLSRPDIGPEAEENAVTLIWPDGQVEELPRMMKRALACEILKRLGRKELA
jgi:phosphopantothenoylcysteine decarboxylase/phosphopantothenate--cysteine ligase